QPEVERDALGVADVQIAVRLGREAGAEPRRVRWRAGVMRRVAGRAGETPAGIRALGEVPFDDLAEEVAAGGGGVLGVAHSRRQERGRFSDAPLAAARERRPRTAAHSAAKLYLGQRARVNADTRVRDDVLN